MSVEPIVVPDDLPCEDCPHCKAEWGHFLHCPLLNATSRQAWLTVARPDEAAKIAAHALGIEL